jgi:transcriptional regulator with XRE-family HTH domain
MDGRLLRLSRRISQAELARRAGVSQPAVSRLETGRRRVGPDVRSRVAAALAEILAQEEISPRPGANA